MPELKRVAFYPDLPINSAIPQLRVAGPLRHAGMQLLVGVSRQGRTRHVDVDIVSSADIVVLQRSLNGLGDAYDQIVQRARSQGKPIVYDLDDLLARLPDFHPDKERYRPELPGIVIGLCEADLVTVSTSALRTHALEFNPNVEVLPNYLDDDVWQARTRVAKGTADTRLVIGYIAGHSHAPDLEMVAAPLERMLKDHADSVVLRVWGVELPDRLARLRNVRKCTLEESARLNYRTFARTRCFDEIDIGIAPLVDCPFARAKSNIKFLEYSMMGVSGVYSDIPPYADVVRHGECGFLARTEEHWYEYLDTLIRDARLRTTFGYEAQRTVKSAWMLSQHAYRWRQSYGTAAERARNSRNRGQVIHRDGVASANGSVLEVLKQSAQQLRRQEEQLQRMRTSLSARFTSRLRALNSILRRGQER